MAGSTQGQAQHWRRQGAWVGLLAIVVVGVWPLLSGAAGAEAASLGPTTVAVRQDITRLTATQLASFRRGIAVMQSRPETDPTSWLYQAHIHGFPAPGEDSACAPPTSVPQPAWASCQHGSFFFLAWHRLYLYYFERILRQAAGDPTLTLPYWDYSRADSRELPLPFRQPANASNPLFIPERDPDANAGTLRLQDTEVDAQQALRLLPFFVGPERSSAESFGGSAVALPVHFGTFAGLLEFQPHNVIHTVVGGPTGFMSDPNCAARDPIFFVHHANIDRLWEAWLRQGGGRVNPTSNVWLRTPFTFFDEHGQPVTLTARDILDTATQLGYRYDDASSLPPAGPAVAATQGASDEGLPASQALEALERLAVLSDSGLQAVDLGPQGGAVHGQLSEDGGALLRAPATGTSPARLGLVLADVQLVKPGASFAVYLNLPAGAAPDATSRYYVGNLALFGAAPHGEHAAHGLQGSEVLFDVTDTVRALQERGEWRDDFTLTFVRHTRSAPTPTEPPVFLRVGRVLLMQF
jgi:tyrosinase